MRSTLASSRPPSLGRPATGAGQFDQRSVATRRAQAPSTHTDSVNDGSSDTMRCGGAGKVTGVPRSSTRVMGAAVAEVAHAATSAVKATKAVTAAEAAKVARILRPMRRVNPTAAPAA